MNEDTKPATNFYADLIPHGTVNALAGALSSKVFAQQAATQLTTRWATVSVEDALADIREKHPTDKEATWDALATLGYNRGLHLVPEKVFKAIPLEGWHIYVNKVRGSGPHEKETILSLALSGRNLPPDYKAYLKSLPNKPNIPDTPPKWPPTYTP